MRFDLRLLGRTDSGKECYMVTTVYASSGQQIEEEAAKAAAQGPWYYKGTDEVVPLIERITVENGEHLNKRPDQRTK
jgi:hypothetical protein